MENEINYKEKALEMLGLLVEQMNENRRHEKQMQEQRNEFDNEDARMRGMLSGDEFWQKS